MMNQVKALRFPHYKQHDMMDCGPTCLKIISKFYGKFFDLEKIRGLSQIGKTGVSLLGISKAAENLGLHTVGGNMTYEKLQVRPVLPCIVHWRKNHFVVLYKMNEKKVYISDPGSGLQSYTKEEFLNNWAYTKIQNEPAGIVLLVKPTTTFYDQEEDQKVAVNGIGYLLKHLMQYKSLIRQLFAGLLAGALIQLILPFLTKALVDMGVKGQNLNIIYAILLGQLFIVMGQTSVEFIRGWIVLHITSRVNVEVLSSFLHKLFRLPLTFFDSKLNGDILQRIEDHKRIENLLSGASLNTLFSAVTFIVFSIVLFAYNPVICAVFIGGSILYFAWLSLFLAKREKLDFKRFEITSQNRSKTMELLNGICEIKINNCGTQKIWEWEELQARLFRFNIQTLSLSQYQQIGSAFINQAKNIFILFLAARLVIKNEMTLGDMMAIQFIVGQMNNPIAQMATFIQTYQEAKISMERLGQIQVLEEEEDPRYSYINALPEDRSLLFKDVSFVYPGAGNKVTINHLNLTIQSGKTTAIVGASGSGKTTLLKLMLRICKPTEGEIIMENNSFENLSPDFWRQHCGVVLQDGYIFSDTIANNIALNKENLSVESLQRAIHIANLQDYIASQPLGFQTKIGDDGKGISGGQRQRILIARMVYKNPEYIFLDEATSALDASNEKIIIERLNAFLQGKTVVIVAHRLSTVKNADHIIVLDNGAVAEQGTHAALVSQKGYYYKLIKNQLELGN